LILVPVIDLLHGHAVHAQQGRRDRYAPLHTPLCRNGEVLPLVQRLVEDWGFERLYLADLDAIQEQGDNHSIVLQILESHPALQLWLDAGLRHPDDRPALRTHARLRGVVGSETWQSAEPLPADCLLSIDSDADGPRDPSGICRDNNRLPSDLILMNLTRVGSDRGPDLPLLAQWRRQAPAARLYMAGGVRHADDLAELRSAGAAGVLLASALHTGRLSPSDLTT
jgi:phosphoribosylformimino-5-aminoimidazole carboxamide ribotide isomerase